MVKIEAVIPAFKLDDVKAALDRLGIEGVSLYEVVRHGGQPESKTWYRGQQYVVDVRKVKVELLASSLRVEEIVEAIGRAARTRERGDDSTILVFEVADAIRIRTGERLAFALS